MVAKRKEPSFTLEQWPELINNIDTLPEFAAYEEMLREDCRIMMLEWGVAKVSDLMDLARTKHKELATSI